MNNTNEQLRDNLNIIRQKLDRTTGNLIYSELLDNGFWAAISGAIGNRPGALASLITTTEIDHLLRCTTILRMP